LCPHHCLIESGNFGFCGARENQNGILMARTYGVISSFGFDPIEKKPLFHFCPGKLIASFGSYGCNFKCQFCQNFSISQCVASGTKMSVNELVQMSLLNSSSIGIAATYNEPCIQIEYLLDLFKANREVGKKNVVISNGFVEREPLKALLALTDAFNIDLKGYTEGFYREICQGHLKPVIENISSIYGKSHLELTFLLIPGLNDRPKDLAYMFEAIQSIGRDIPLHISGYYPNYKMTIPPTSYNALLEVVSVARKYLDYVYLGNVYDHENNTICRQCGFILVKRFAGSVIQNFQNEKCPSCQSAHKIHFD
jgi:pyruvate formate lyase activating enzyme